MNRIVYRYLKINFRKFKQIDFRVFEVSEKVTKEILILKIVHKDNSKLITNEYAEIYAYGSLYKIDGILKLYKFGHIEDYYFISFIKNSNLISLKKYLSLQTLNEKICVVIFKKLFKIILDCRKNNIIHRNISLENILIDKNNTNCYLIGFSTCSTYQPYYINDIRYFDFICPELNVSTCVDIKLNYNTYFTNETTVWSLGIILYYLLNGKDDFNWINELKSLKPQRIQNKSSNVLARLVEKCLEYYWFNRISLNLLKEEVNLLKI